MADVKRGDAVVLAGTRKGLFLLHSSDRRRWSLEGPFFPGAQVRDATLDPRDGRTVWAAVTSDHWGPSVQRSTTWGASWQRGKDAIRFPKESGLSVERVWSVTPGVDGDAWAGTEPAGLFRSTDGGDSWVGVEGFNARPERKDWMPGGGGLCLHTILPYPGDRRRMVVAASAVGVLGTNDGGASWRPMHAGIRKYSPEGEFLAEGEIGTCPHKLVRAAGDPALLYMQNHLGMYRRRRGEDRWTLVEHGLPSRFGFPLAAHPRDARTVYAVPLEGDHNRVTKGGAMVVYRTRDGGDSWAALTQGLPQNGAWFTVLREGLATDALDPVGVYVGTTTGQLYASPDEGESWEIIADRLPQIVSVTASVAGPDPAIA